MLLEDALGVALAAIDVEKGYIVLDSDLRYGGIDFIGEFQRFSLANFNSNVSLDLVSNDYLTKKLKECLQSIGNPPAALQNQAVIEVMGMTRRRGARKTAHTPAANFLWNAQTMDSTPALCPKGKPFSTLGSPLLDSVENRLQVIWGASGNWQE